MSFITQGKTNLKYILIVVVLAIIVGGGIVSIVSVGWKKLQPTYGPDLPLYEKKAGHLTVTFRAGISEEEIEEFFRSLDITSWQSGNGFYWKGWVVGEDRRSPAVLQYETKEDVERFIDDSEEEWGLYIINTYSTSPGTEGKWEGTVFFKAGLSEEDIILWLKKFPYVTLKSFSSGNSWIIKVPVGEENEWIERVTKESIVESVEQSTIWMGLAI